MVIESGDSPPRKVKVRRMPLAVRREVARQLKDMQRAGVIRPLSSPWSSPVVMVRKNAYLFIAYVFGDAYSC